MIDIEHWDFGEACVSKRLQNLVGNFIASFSEDFTGLNADKILANILADQIFVGREQKLRALFCDHTGRTLGQFLARFENNLSGVGVDQIGRRLHALHALCAVRHAPSVLRAGVDDIVVEGRQNGFAIKPQSVKQGSDRQFTATIDTCVNHILRIKFNIEP